MPQVKTALGFRDHLGSARARAGVARNQYKVNPGLYCTGAPGSESPVFVTANYKLSFDSLRRELAGLDAWILVVDTRGINVWCAAGKGTFSDDEIALQVKRTGLARIVSHRELILPQFAATGVAAYKLKKKCGFIGIFGPLRAKDIRNFIRNNKQADETMRAVTFTFAERLVLVPVEILLIWKIVSACHRNQLSRFRNRPGYFFPSGGLDERADGGWRHTGCRYGGGLVHPGIAAMDTWAPVVAQGSDCRCCYRHAVPLDRHG